MAEEGSVNKRNMIRSRSLGISRTNPRSLKDRNEAVPEQKGDRVQEFLKHNLLSTYASLLETCIESRRVQEVSSYSLFTHKPLHKLQLKSKVDEGVYGKVFCPTGLELDQKDGRKAVC